MFASGLNLQEPITEYSEELGTKTYIILGRGGELNRTNSKYRNFLSEYRPTYNSLKKGEKRSLVHGIIQHLLNNGVIFQKRDIGERLVNITDRSVIEKKMSVFLRDKRLWSENRTKFRG